MHCPYCSHVETRVLDSRPTDEGSAVRRRRQCSQCEERFTTYERLEAAPAMVIKKDGRREPFDREKILGGMMTACEKRPVTMGQLEAAVREVERELRAAYEREVETGTIGELVMEQLRQLDEVAYVRFASVYRQFRDLETFRRELERLLAAGED